MCARSHSGSNRLPQGVLNQIAFVTRQGCSIRMAGTTGTKRKQVQIWFNTEYKRFSVPASRFEAAKADANKWMIKGGVNPPSTYKHHAMGGDYPALDKGRGKPSLPVKPEI